MSCAAEVSGALGNELHALNIPPWEEYEQEESNQGHGEGDECEYSVGE